MYEFIKGDDRTEHYYLDALVMENKCVGYELQCLGTHLEIEDGEYYGTTLAKFRRKFLQDFKPEEGVISVHVICSLDKFPGSMRAWISGSCSYGYYRVLCSHKPEYDEEKDATKVIGGISGLDNKPSHKIGFKQTGAQVLPVFIKVERV